MAQSPDTGCSTLHLDDDECACASLLHGRCTSLDPSSFKPVSGKLWVPKQLTAWSLCKLLTITSKAIKALTAMALVAGDWAAFMTASTVQPEAPATAPAEDSGWDAFQSSEVAASTGGAGGAVPFDPFGESQSVEAAAGRQQAAEAPSAGVGVPPSTPPKHAAKKSADDILKMFDAPQQSAFAQFPATGMSQGLAGTMPGFAMQQVINLTKLYVRSNAETPQHHLMSVVWT